ncbi:hypothetical protein [Bradyrhizobium sp. CW11]|uniref:hypothetical protein n=1 Tax=Bradyrhizobium sp. CW11 TaxID=2782684 RepID=UPI001FF86156|nr:hypothetical protein [Bradyrhizobium sp. CW11]MCK1346344.1 hypothetical protein [Bradyrhizobium sp. CW11]
MPFTAKVYRVLIASPSDLTDERKIAIDTVYEWNAQHAEAESVILLPVAWETHATPRANVRPQQAINEQLVDKSDILVGMFWTKLGTSTGVAESGTVEEIDRFVAAGKPALLYFSSKPIDPAAIDPTQNKRLKAFREATHKIALAGSFNSLDSLRQVISRNLLSEVRNLNIRGTRETTESAAAASQSRSLTDANEGQTRLTPDESWDRNDYELAAFSAIRKNDDAKIKILSSAYEKTADDAQEDNHVTWHAYLEWSRVLFGKGGQLQRLKKLAESNPESHQTLFYLGSAYAHFEQHGLAASTYLYAITASKRPEDVARCAALAAENFRKAKDANGVETALDKLRKLVADEPSLESVLTEAVQKLAEADKLEPFSIALMERCMELRPDDHEMRFNLAFKQSDAGDDAIALHHYQKISIGDRQSVTWNNIGVSADQLGLPAKSVAAYKRAASMGDTLAMSNLANKLMKSGFLELAREQCNEALQDPRPHQNIGHLVASLATMEAAEQTRLDELFLNIRERMSHLRKLGQAATFATPQTIAKEWQGAECTFTLSRDADQIVLRGEYEREAGGLLAALVSDAPRGGALTLPKARYSVRYTGRIRGRGIAGTVKRERVGGTILENAGEPSVFLILSETGDEITIVEGVQSEAPRLDSLARI